MNYDHEEFEGRAEYPGFDPVDNATGSNQEGLDCDGHGTHVASLAAGRIHGVAKKARIHSVRVLNCSGGGPWSTVISGINYVVQKASETGRPSVISMSLSGPKSNSVNMAVENAVNGNESLGIQGVPVVVAAGDDNGDACNYSPASTSKAITVGSSTIENQLSSSTNVGPCVDIFAPGTDIYGASSNCISCYQYKNGTSMATPLVSGAIALMLTWQPQLTPSEVYELVIKDSIKNALDFSTYNFTLATPERFSLTMNRLLHILSKLHYTYMYIVCSYAFIIVKAHPNYKIGGNPYFGRGGRKWLMSTHQGCQFLFPYQSAKTLNQVVYI